MENNKEDKWQLALKEELVKLKKCQEDKGLKSCFNCEALLTCEIRSKYIKSVYLSMSEGKTGDFEFDTN